MKSTHSHARRRKREKRQEIRAQWHWRMGWRALAGSDESEGAQLGGHPYEWLATIPPLAPLAAVEQSAGGFLADPIEVWFIVAVPEVRIVGRGGEVVAR